MAQRPDPEVKVGMGDVGGAELHLPLLRGALAGIIRYPHSRPDVAEGLGPWHSLGFCVHTDLPLGSSSWDQFPLVVMNLKLCLF